ncbi:MAG: hypothetical protein LBI03_11355 [Clostridiales bacterium]|jgi:stage III sporulation protein AD|nr:hypothetical protein [Clostridiales bacterium]
MTDIFQIIGIAVISAVIISLLRNWKSELALPATIAAGILLLTLISGQLKDIINYINSLTSSAPGMKDNLPVIIKITGIAYLTEFVSGVCRDSGENSIAAKVDIAGRIFIVWISLPVAMSLISIVSGMFNVN